jgi:O-succinylbenzoic acid--CoA ligase
MAADAGVGNCFAVAPERCWSAAAVLGGILRWEAHLRDGGIKPGDRVGVLADPGITTVVQLLAVVRVGAIAVLPSRRWHLQEQERQCHLQGARLILDPDAPWEPLGTNDDLWDLGDRPADDTVQGIYFTSGTSGNPKPVPLTMGNHRASAFAVRERLGIGAQDCWLNCLPLYHIGGQAILWRSLLWRLPFGLVPFTPEAVHRAVATHPLTHCSLVPTMLWRLRPLIDRQPEPWQRLRGILMGGAPLGAELRHWAATLGLPLCPTYGMTETASQITTLLPGEGATKPNSIGRSLSHATLHLRPDGELWVRGAMVSDAVLNPDGWLATGDRASCDGDGYWYIHGRLADTINCGGEKIDPQELEDLLGRHSDVQDICAIAVDDGEWGQVVGVVVVPRPGVTLSLEAVQEFLQTQHLPRYKLPRRLWHWSSLPRTANGKLQRQQVAQRIVTNSSALEG